MRVAILGTGALGCVFAARLADHAEVWMLGSWEQGVAAVQRNGVRVEETDGAIRHAFVHATSDPAAVKSADIALVLVKSYQSPRAAAWASQVLAPHGLAVTLQNGLDNESVLAAAVGAARATAGVTYNGATLLGPGAARHAAHQPTHIGAGPAQAERVTALVALLNRAGLEAHVTTNIAGLLWAKAIANAAINPLTALWRVPNGQACATEARCALLTALAGEAAAVAGAKGVVLPFADPAIYVKDVCLRTAANRSSMLQDVEGGRPTEIDSINGVIVAEGQRLGIPTPVNEVVWRLVRGNGE